MNEWDAVLNVWLKTIYQILMLWINCIIKNILVRHPLSFSATFSLLRKWRNDSRMMLLIPHKKVSSKLMTFLDSSASQLNLLAMFVEDVSSRLRNDNKIHEIIMQHGVCALCLAFARNLHSFPPLRFWGLTRDSVFCVAVGWSLLGTLMWFCS